MLSALSSNPRYRCSVAFSEFIQLYLIITVFVCVTALCLYLSVNLSSIDGVSTIARQAYLEFILIFLALMPIAMARYNAVLYRFKLSKWFKVFLSLAFCHGVTAAIAIRWLSDEWNLVIIALAITLMLATLSIVSLKARKRYQAVYTSNHAKFVSRIMITQSLCLTLAELLLWPEHLGRHGFTASLPVLYLINNLLIWSYREYLMPASRIALNERNMAELLSPKEQEIVQALIKGMANKQIAAQLNVSPSTVKNHIYNIFKKCNVSNRVALIAFLQAK